MKKKPEWIFFSITMESYVKNLYLDIKVVRQEFPDIKVAIGGQGIKDINLKDFDEVDSLIKDNSDLQSLFYVL